MKTGIIYKIKSKTTNKVYIGQTSKSTIDNRQNRHKKDMEKGDTHLYRAMRQYGFDDFEFSIVEENIPIDMLSQREIYWIAKYDSFNTGYNSTTGGEGGNTYARRTPEQMAETKAKISNKMRGENNGNKGQFVGERNGMYGKTMSEETKVNLRKFWTGKKRDEAFRQAVSKGKKGVKKNFTNRIKYLYLLNLTNMEYKKMKAFEIKDILEIENYIEMKNIIDNGLEINNHKIYESVETIEREFKINSTE